MRKIIYIISLFCFLSVSILGQDLRKIAEENPLNCARFLEVNNKDLSRIFWRAERTFEALQILNSLENGHEKSSILYDLSKDSLKKGDKKQAIIILLKLVEIDKDYIDSRLYPKIVEDLVSIGREKEAFDFVQTIEYDDDKFYSLIGIAKGLAKKSEKNKTFTIISQALNLIKGNVDNFKESNPYGELASIYLAIGEKSKASEILNKINYSDIQKWDWVTSLRNIYTKSGNSEKAIKIIEEFEDFEIERKFLEKAIIYAKIGNKVKAIHFLQKIPNNDETRYYQIDIVNLYLELGEDLLALKQAKLVNYEYSQQKSLISIADYYISKKRYYSAREVLNYAFEKAIKITTDHIESGIDSTSPQMMKARYILAIADKFSSMNDFDSALYITNKLEKPFGKASKLADIAERQNIGKAVQLLNQALLIISLSEKGFLDERKYTAWAKVGEKFANLGLKSKALEVFSELLNDYQKNENETYYLMDIGYYFESSKLKANNQIKKSLREIIKREMDED